MYPVTFLTKRITMKLSTIQKLGGVSIIVGSILLTVWTILWTTLIPIHDIAKDFSLLVVSPNWIWITSIVFPSTILMVFGFTAVYSRMYSSAGVIGFSGYVFLVVAYIFQTVLTSWELFLYPIIAHNEASVFLLRDKIILFSSAFQFFRIMLEASIFLGVLLFCIALIKNREFPKVSGYLILLGASAYAVGPMVPILVEIAGVVVLSIGCFLLGWKMLVHQENV
jgi:hypothetical protein